ncbi:hypothetical protein [Planomonospora parontospora]|uniref:hypothetical protein n=1 Tax=Planomonospora parontospora TaxID=58119 RepID=UPI0016709773|nr:hypothetical protein [Planomonospora parontospora]GGL28108.1 hypothetical protein GCM10014719_31970 [Planomonospora parontospora subsp. antibiotica]GII20110.1 hypothetical protein Ppa05_68360 [Planomonospora parontospora subsp. antibiotica]
MIEEASPQGAHRQPEAPTSADAEPEQQSQEQDSSAAGDPAPENTDDDLDESALGQTATVINNFFAEVQAQGSAFGMTGGPAARSISGRLDRKDIERALQCFVEPAAFPRALMTLRERHLVVLVGGEDIGKWTSGIALLDAVKANVDRVVVLPPDRRLGDLLSTVSAKRNRVYFIHDWIENGTATSARRFDLEALSAGLMETQSYLVITLNRAETEAELAVFEIPWSAPDPSALFAACLGQTWPTSEIARVQDRVAELRTPRQVAELAGQLREGSRSAEEILADLGGDTVSRWFDGQPGRSDVLTVAALAFAYGMPERIFERLVVELKDIADEIECQGAERERRPIGDDLPQTRMLWNNRHPLIGTSSEPGERQVIFCGVRHREHVIRQLHHRYDYRLWQPLREWIRGLADDRPETQVQAAAGLALLSRTNPEEVQESFLETWAGGTVQERLAAASTLSLMCTDDGTATVALACTLGWVENAGQPQAMTAALAFAGGLSIRYPVQAVGWLWYLSLRGIRVSTVAQRALVLLFQGAAERDGDALTELQLLARHVDRDLTEGMEPMLARRALSAVLGVLGADRLSGEQPGSDGPENGRPLMASLLLAQPDSAKPIGVLWAWALHNAHHRARAVRALCRTLDGLSGKDGAVAAADALGRAVWSKLPGSVAVLVRRAIDQAAGASIQPQAGPAREIVLTLLNAGTPRTQS